MTITYLKQKHIERKMVMCRVHPISLEVGVVLLDVTLHENRKFFGLRGFSIFTGFGEHLNRFPVQLIGFAD